MLPAVQVSTTQLQPLIAPPGLTGSPPNFVYEVFHTPSSYVPRAPAEFQPLDTVLDRGITTFPSSTTQQPLIRSASNSVHPYFHIPTPHVPNPKSPASSDRPPRHPNHPVHLQIISLCPQIAIGSETTPDPTLQSTTRPHTHFTALQPSLSASSPQSHTPISS